MMESLKQHDVRTQKKARERSKAKQPSLQRIYWIMGIGGVTIGVAIAIYHLYKNKST